MLSSLQEGSLVYIIDKTDSNIKYKFGEVLTKSNPVNDYNSQPIGMQIPTYFDLTIKIDNEKYDFKHISTNVSIVNYNNGNIIISETKEGLIPIVENIHNTNKQIINNIEQYKKSLPVCEEILSKLNPTFAKEKEQEHRISNLENKLNNVDSKLDKLFNILNKE